MNVWSNFYAFKTTLYSHYSRSSCYISEVPFAIEQRTTEILNVKILIRVRPLGINLTFFVSLGIAEISRLSKFSVYSEVVILKTFSQHLELCFYRKYSRSYEAL